MSTLPFQPALAAEHTTHPLRSHAPCCSPSELAGPFESNAPAAYDDAIELRGSSEISTVSATSAVELALDREGSAGAPAIREQVRGRYAAAAREVAKGRTASCGSSCCGEPTDGWNPITSGLYDEGLRAEVPEAAVRASLGCGNPTALAELHPGEVVLDLGSGGGIDVILSARRVGPSGKAYGLDMTDEMLALARSNAEHAGVENVEFLRGEIEAIPLPDASVDVIISNCVINLSADKQQVLREAFRVLKPGGRFAVSDIVARRRMPEPVRHSMELWLGCVAGALEEREFERLLEQVGFTSVSIEPTRIYGRDDARALVQEGGIGEDATEALDGAFASAFVRATKPRESDPDPQSIPAA